MLFQGNYTKIHETRNICRNLLFIYCSNNPKY